MNDKHKTALILTILILILAVGCLPNRAGAPTASATSTTAPPTSTPAQPTPSATVDAVQPAPISYVMALADLDLRGDPRPNGAIVGHMAPGQIALVAADRYEGRQTTVYQITTADMQQVLQAGCPN